MHTIHGFVSKVAWIALVSIGALWVGLAHAQSPDKIPLESALSDLAARSGLQLAYRTEVTRGMMVKPAPVGLKPQDELRVLLKGTGLEAQKINETTLTIRRSTPAASVDVAAGVADLRLARAQVDPQQTTQEDLERRNADLEQDSKGIPEILVKGKRSLNGDIRRTEDDPQPYVVFDGQEIERSQALTLEDFLRTRLPMNTASSSIGQTTGQSATFSSINLRGLGSNQTLILVDGRRLPGLASDGSPFQADLNGIPLSAIERIEVLPSTAGGIYGGSATGGVINVIMRRDFKGLEAKATYANTFDTDVANRRLDLSTGFSLEGGRTRVTIAATHSDGSKLVLGDRDFAARAFGLTLAHNRNLIIGGATPPLGATVNIRSVSGNLVLDQIYGGRALGSNITNIPLGYAGPASDSGAALLANAGQYNVDLPAGVNGRERGLLAAPSMDSATLNLNREFSERLQVFLDLSRLGNNGSSFNANVPNSVTNLAAGAPNNPFQQNIRVRFPTPGLRFESQTESTTLRATSGLIMRLPRNWTGEVDYGWSRSRLESRFGGSIVNGTAVIDSVGSCVLGRGVAANVDPDGAGPLQPCAGISDLRPALNILQEGNVSPLDFSPYLLPSPNQTLGPYSTTLKDATLRVSGPLFTLPGGPVSLAAYLEHREEDIENAFIELIDPTSREPTYSLYPHRSQDTDSYYAEARIPLVSSAMKLPLMRLLELQASARRDEYKTMGDANFDIPVLSPDDPLPPVNSVTSRLESTDYTFGLRYMPIEDLTLRGSFGTGFLPPNVTQIAPTVDSADFSMGLDPRRGNTNMYVGVPYAYLSGGNPNLKPEHSTSASAGLILTPRIAPGLRLSIDYTRIDKIDEFRIPNYQFLIANEAALQGRIVRGAKLDDDLDSWAGPIISIDQSYINIAETSVQAYDIQADYTLNTETSGEFHWSVLATRQTHFKTRIASGEPSVDSVGFTNAPLEWRGNVGLSWDRGPLALGWNMQYYDSYAVYAANAPASLIASTTLNQGAGRIPRQVYHDLIATYRLERLDTDLSFGIQNLFDKSPPIVASTSPTAGGYSTYGDPRLRRYSISLRKSFQ